MRWLGRGLLALILLIALLSLYPMIPANLLIPFSSESASRNLPDEARATSVYWLSEKDWLRYSFQGRPDLARILTHVQLTTDLYSPDEDVRFGVRYRVVDAEGAVIKEKDYFFRTTILPPRKLPDGRTFPARFYADTAFVASADQILFIDLRAHPSAASIELKTIELPPGGQRIGVRAAQQETLSDAAAALKWQRMNDDTRADQVEAHVYPYYLVSTFEILNQSSRRWLPLGPVGVEGTSFLSDSLYLLDAAPSPEPESGVKPAGLKADADNWVTLPLPGPGTQNYRLEFTPVDATGPVTVSMSHQANSDLGVIHYTVRSPQAGDAASAPEEQDSSDDQAPIGSFSWSGELTPGLLQIIAGQAVSVRLIDPQTNEEITPPRQFVSGFKTSSEQSLSYRLNPDTGAPQPLRLDFRAMNHPDLGLTELPAQVTIQFHDSQQNLLEEFESAVTPLFSPYQRFASEGATSLSESESLYAMAPEAAASVAIQSQSPLLTTLYSRAANLPVKRVLPAQQRPWEDYDNRLASWFINQPIDAANLLRQNRKSSIVWFFKPIEVDLALQQGIYEWESLDLLSPAPQQRLMFPYQTDESIRETALPSLYQRIGQLSAQINLQASVPGVPIQPQLVFSRSTGSPANIRVFRDGQLWLKRGIAGKRGRFSLPPVTAGQYELRIDGEGDWFINHSPSGQPYLQRLAYRLDGNKLSFTVDKRTPTEVVGFQLFTASELESYQVRVTVSGAQRKPGLLTDYTLRQREYTLTGHPDTTLGIQGDGGNWSEPYRFVVPLGDDIPEGTHTVTLTPSSPGAALVTAFRILEGQQAPYRFFKEAQSDQ